MTTSTFSDAVKDLQHLNGMHYDRTRDRLIASGIGNRDGIPTEFAYFLDRLYGACLEESAFWRGGSNLYRMIAAGKTIWEARQRFMPNIGTRVICAVGAIIAKGSIHRRKFVFDETPFFEEFQIGSDLLDEAMQLIRTERDLRDVAEGEKNKLLANRGVDSDQFRKVRAEWTRMVAALGGGVDSEYSVIKDENVRLRCAIIAGTHWVNTFERYGILQEIAVCSVLRSKELEINLHDSGDMVVVGWNIPMSSEDMRWDMSSLGYPLTMATKAELEQYAPDLLEASSLKEQLEWKLPAKTLDEYKAQAR